MYNNTSFGSSALKAFGNIHSKKAAVIIKNKLLPVVLIILLLSNVSTAGTKKIMFDGTFIQAGLCGSWTSERWKQEFTIMKNAGMHYLIIGAVAESVDGQKAKMLYPSALPNTELNKVLNGKDMVDLCLKNAEEAGIKVFIGIGMNEKWWDFTSLDSTWLYNQMEFDNKVCDEVWALYKDKYPSAFYGWYWVYEIANVNLTEIQQRVLTNAMNMQLDHMTSTNKKLPFMWCPFMNTKFGGVENYKLIWQNILAGLHTTKGDIFAPQDCVGAGGLELNEVATWFSALRQAADTKPGLEFWSDVETFDYHDWSSATLDRIISQMKIEAPYVENYITFAYSHYQSDPGFLATYKDYLNKGVLETTPPTKPENFTAVLQENGDIVLNWNASADNIGVCGYYIYRNDTMIHKKQVAERDGGKRPDPPFSFTDTKLSPGAAYTYQVQAYDFANNVSPLTVPVKITIPAK